LTNTPVGGTQITYASPIITVGTAGVYQLTYGAAMSAGTQPFIQLSVNSVVVAQSGLEVIVNKDMRYTSTILNLAAGSTLQVVNGGTTSITLNITLTGGPSAFLSIIKI
jgi:hypothetical protein